MQQPTGRIRSPQPPIAVPSTGRSILTGLRLVFGILVFAWAAGQLGWAGWLLAGPRAGSFPNRSPPLESWRSGSPVAASWLV